MQRSFTIFIDDGGFDIKATVRVIFEVVENQYEPKNVSIENVYDVETNTRWRQYPSTLKSLIESEAFRVAKQDGPF